MKPHPNALTATRVPAIGWVSMCQTVPGNGCHRMHTAASVTPAARL